MNNQSLISVIVPIYNIDKYVGLCIESIIGQTYKNLEIILVDDGSTDRSSELCDLYAKKDKRINVIHKKNGGLVSARKAGMLAATGEYIGYVDGDDWIGEGFYQSMYSIAVTTDADVVAAGFSRDLFAKKNSILNTIPEGVYEGEALDLLRSHMISHGGFFKHGITTYLWNKLFKRECIIRQQLAVDDRITIGEDAAVVYPVLMECSRVCVTGNCAYHYRQREDSMLKKTGEFKDEALKLHILYEFMQNSFKRYDNKYDLKNQTDDFITATYIIRSGGYVPTDFAYSSEVDGKNVVIYGAGTFGQQMKNRMSQTNYCNVTGWVDVDYHEYRRCCMDVDDISMITEMDYDYVLVATLDHTYAQEIKQILLDFGVDITKILFVDCQGEKKRRLLDYYLSL